MRPDCICVPVFGPGSVDRPRLWQAAGFAGEPGQDLFAGEYSAPVLLVGFGSRERLTLDTVRDVAALAGKRLGHLDSVGWDFEAFSGLPLDAGSVVRALAEGSALGAYRPGSGQRPATSWQEPVGAAGGFWQLGLAVAAAVTLVRDLVNCPPNLLPPAAFAQRCREAAQECSLEIVVSGESDLHELGMGGLLAIGQGSPERPLLVEITHRGDGGPPALGLVGKGVTFDSGGLSLKPADGMIGMKHDMAGAATVLGAMTLLPALAPNLHVKAYLPVAENLPGPGAARPGDVVTMRNGRTVEILNTDFEGRVILADALSLAAEQSPAAMIDVATLTHAAVNALGDRTAALLGNSPELMDLVASAARAAGEPVWPLPMPGYLREQLLSDVADYKNFPGVPAARALTAALFLAEFVPKHIPWVHLDIAGPAWADTAYGLTSPGGTGYGVRLLAEIFTQLRSF